MVLPIVFSLPLFMIYAKKVYYTKYGYPSPQKKSGLKNKKAYKNQKAWIQTKYKNLKILNFKDKLITEGFLSFRKETPINEVLPVLSYKENIVNGLVFRKSFAPYLNKEL